MAIDAQRFVEISTFINLVWSAPFQIVVALIFLYLELGTDHTALYDLSSNINHFFRVLCFWRIVDYGSYDPNQFIFDQDSQKIANTTNETKRQQSNDHE